MNKSLIFFYCFLMLFCHSCQQKDKYKKYIIRDISKPVTDTLIVDTNERVGNVEILFNGYIDGKALFQIENGSGRFNKIYLTKDINQKYETEWYDKKIVFNYIPKDSVKGGKLILKYRIY